MESQMELSWKQREIPDGTQMEAKEAKIDSQDRIQVIQVIQVIPEQMPGT